eukprot:scaffold378_cov270-Chaetoceros_neogracile.AAC.32
MRGFVSIAVEYGCAYSIQRAVDDKSGEDNMDHGYESMDGKTNLDMIQKLIKDSLLDNEDKLITLMRQLRQGRES